MNQSAPRDLSALYTARLNAIYGADPHVIPSRRRDDFAVELRFTLWLALHDSGWSIEAIRQIAHRDHSTVSHGLAAARAKPAMVDVAARIRADVMPPAALGRLLALERGEAAQVYCYLWWLLGGTPFDTDVYAGLWLIAGDPALRVRLAEMLEGYMVAGHLWRAEIHARQAGIPWRSARGLCG